MCHPLDLPRLPRKEEEFLFLSDLIYGLSLSLFSPPPPPPPSAYLSLATWMVNFDPKGGGGGDKSGHGRGARMTSLSLPKNFPDLEKKSRSLLHKLMFVLKWPFLPNCRLAPEYMQEEISIDSDRNGCFYLSIFFPFFLSYRSASLLSLGGMAF